MRARRRPRAARSLFALVACLVIATVAAPGLVSPAPAETISGPGFEVTATPTSDLIDGSPVAINVKSSGANIYEAQARVCRSGVDYQPGGSVTNPDFRGNGPNCPLAGVSTSADTLTGSSDTFTFAPTPEGDTFIFRVGVGVAAWTDGTEARTLTCDVQNPCSLVVQLRTDAGGQLEWLPIVFDLSYLESDPVAGCGGGAPGILRTATTDALNETWIGWTLATCNTQGTSGAWTGMTFGDETLAVDRFARGEIDVVYSGVGYDPGAGFVGEDLPDGPRPMVAVPVGLNASVLAVANGWTDPNFNNRKKAYGPISLTLDETAAMVSGGPFGSTPFEVDMIVRNPELGLPGVYQLGASVQVAGPSEGSSATWLTTRHLDVTSPGTWRVPEAAQFAPNSGRDRGPSSSLALADPGFNVALTLYTGRPALTRELARLGVAGGGVWILTDRTTASAFNLRTVSLETADGSAFVPADSTTMAAAADAMPIDDTDGMRMADPNSNAGYPLTYVVYAMVPAEPLVDPDTGQCRTDSQDLMAKWLTYAVRDGQSNIPAGLEPLTPTLQAEAEERLQQVGQSGESACPVPAIPPPDGGTTPPPAAVSSAGTGDSAPAGSAPPSSAGGAAVMAASDDLVEQANAELTLADDDDNPGFFGGALPSMLAAIGALIAVGGLTAVAARQTGNRALPPGPEMTALPPPPDQAGVP